MRTREPMIHGECMEPFAWGERRAGPWWFRHRGPRPATNPQHHALIRARHFQRARMIMSDQSWPRATWEDDDTFTGIERVAAWHDRDDTYEDALHRTLGLGVWR